MLNRLSKYVPMLWLSIMTLACTNAVIGRRTVINHNRALQQALTTSRTTGNSPKTGVSANLENLKKKCFSRFGGAWSFYNICSYLTDDF